MEARARVDSDKLFGFSQCHPKQGFQFRVIDR
jgi:hypothetical protein